MMAGANNLAKLREKMVKDDVDGVILLNFEDRNRATTWYVSGFSGSFAVLLISQKKEYILTDSRYYTQAAMQTSFELIPLKNGMETVEETIIKFVEEENIKRLGIEEERITLAHYKDLFSRLENVEILSIDETIKGLRSVKSPEEIEKIKVAIDVAEKALLETLNIIKPGITEQKIAAVLEYEMRKRGGIPAFETIVASGYRSAIVHGRSSEKKVKEGEFILIDYGAMVNGYCSDITRTFCLGTPSDEMVKVYEIVYNTQKTCREAAKAGMVGKELHLMAVDMITNAGYGEYFGHGLGHGLGMEVHEAPAVGLKNENPLPSGAVVTIEPGIYIPEKFGVRIEDDVLLTDNGAVILTTLDRKLKTL
ncbi:MULTISPECIES: Xaa-Pro peptidase family protein [Kosmotoga]|uniref:Peptidase M24 n=1 Tax=Kosmotoga olearia (strain ATCC BAA-1733 / DSM 21960 / TBF 19.5.1) TaxID=521045 RepID=C5CI93_KOSOT|nr:MULTISPECIES: Xaa-Pro peptidase family protein [Kosmotoga]ACR80795.1 peptidase M24 [Kosmotoga olearia TBF 19.5.1]MDI3523965.1 hypothetical protein [Kosmotoga sp.]MDK2952722.1 hypothetical protein [Kosmotoga sp.]OAA19239.1 peptidase M24 [Kosmotoga sp. DU53]